MVLFIYWNVKIESNTRVGVFLDKTVSFKHHISYVCTRISRNNGTLAKLRHFLTLSQMKQLYYSIIFPYILHVILAWGSTYKTHINKVQSKQNHSIRLIFVARTFGDQTESALPLLNLLDVLTVNNVYRLQALKFTHSWHKGLLPSLFHDFFQYASEVHGYYTRYASRQNLYASKVRTNSGKQTINCLYGEYSLGQYPYSSKRSQYLQLLEISETLFTVWTTFWKLVIFLYAPFSNFMYISHSLNNFFPLKSP